MTRPAVMIGTPCYGGQVTHLFLHSMLDLVMYAPLNNFGVGLRTIAKCSLIPLARNSLIAAFLDSPATHLMFIDADIGFKAADVHRLLTFDEDFVAGMYPIKSIDWARLQQQVTNAQQPPNELGLHFVGMPCVGDTREERDGFVTAEAAGAGFTLLRRAAVERLRAAHPELKYQSAQSYPRPAQQSQNQYNLFDCMISPETGVYLSEDFSFCRRWRRLGGKIWIDTRTRLTHVGSYEFRGAPAFG
jgi:hypothetical protein